jgi:hypothetical protein
VDVRVEDLDVCRQLLAQERLVALDETQCPRDDVVHGPESTDGSSC